VAELDGYRKIIEGARQVLANYKPTIRIDPTWPKVEIGIAPIDIIDGDRGLNYPKKEDFSESGDCLFLNTSNVRENGFRFDQMEFITKQKDEALRKGKLKRNDVVLTTRGTVGNVALFDESVRFEQVRINSGMVILRVESEKIAPSFLYTLIQTNYIQEQFEKIVSGCAQPQLPIRSLVEIVIPLPPLAIQREIVAEIEAERALLEANRKLMELFEKKIQSKLAEAWGEEENSRKEAQE
jgi:restriction endonuclease S subunit